MLTKNIEENGGHTFCSQPLIAYGDSSRAMRSATTDSVWGLTWGEFFWMAAQSHGG
jgi:hypothetical protein